MAYPLAYTSTRVLCSSAGETANLAGETRSPHQPRHGCSRHLGNWATGQLARLVTGRVPLEEAAAARTVDGPLEPALGTRRPPRTVKR